MPKIEISIRRKRPVPRSNAGHKGPLDIHPEPDYLKRRLRGGIIRFFDLGQKSDGHGGWIQNNFSHDPQWRVNSAPGDDNIVSDDPVTIDIIRDFEASMLGGVSRVNFPTTFRQIHKSDGNSFPVGVDGTFYDSDDWIEEGMKISQTRLDDIYANNNIRVGVRRSPDPSISVSGGFAAQDLLSQDVDITVDPHVVGSEYKPTGPYTADEAASFTDPSAKFRPGLNDCYFLVPQFTQDLGQSVSGLVTVYQNNFAHMIPRNFTDHNYTIASTPSYPGGIQFADPAWSEALGYHQAMSYARTLTVTGTVSGPFIDLSLTPGGTFPFPGGGDFTEMNFYSSDSVGQGVRFDYLGQLSLIIKQGDKYYYFWNKLSNSVEP